MIKDENGRTFSVRTPDELEDLLKADIESLTDEEREVFYLLVDELKSGKAAERKSLLWSMRDADFIREPVDIETFVRDPYYLGNTCDGLYSKWMEDLKELFSDTYDEAIFTGAIGTGKTFTASIGVCRILYEISCLRDPQKTFGLATGSNISIVVLSVTEYLAMKAGLENIASKVQASPYFNEHFPFQVTQKELRFPHKVWVAPRATNDHSALGLNVIATLLDETNFLKKGQNPQSGIYVDQARTIYTSLMRRMKSRFEKRGKLPGIMFLVSSKQTSDDFTAERVRKSLSNPKVFCRDYSLWDVKPEDYDQAETFPVLAGNDQVTSRILTDDEARDYKARGLPENAVLLDVPVAFRQDFIDNLEGAIRDIAGVSTVAIRPYITQREKIFEAVKKDLKHPFSKEVWDPSQPGSFLWQQMTERVEHRAPTGVMETLELPKLSPTAMRHARFDMSLTRDATGLCVAHVAGYKDVIRKDDEGNKYAERAPLIVVDLLLRVVPPVGGEIDLAALRRLLYELTAHGYSISKVTMDQFQSADAIQTLNRRGYNAELLSVDLTTDPYESLKQALYEGRVWFYEYEPLISELKTLQRNITKSGRRVKIDHPPKGSKDVADALAGVVFSLTQDRAHDPLPIVQHSHRPEDPWMLEQLRGEDPNVRPSSPLPEYAKGQGGGPLPIMGSGDTGDWDPQGGDGWENF